MLEIILVAALLVVDQVSKLLTDLYLTPLGTSYPLWDGVLHFTSAHNTGAAFSMLAGGRWIFVALTVIVCAAGIIFLIKKRKRITRLARVAVSLIIAGALGNMIDRIIFGYVRDMIEFRFMHFAIFNVADSILCIGAALLILYVLIFDGKKVAKRKAHKENSVDGER